MFDPTIYENIKVVLEGEIYEADLAGEILVTMRKDIVNLAEMSRTFTIRFALSNTTKDIYSELQLFASTADLANEILETKPVSNPGCELIIKFFMPVEDYLTQCKKVVVELDKIWDYRPEIGQKLSFTYNEEADSNTQMINEITLEFGRKIDEDNINDIHSLIRHTVNSLNQLMGI